jgi:hypothetical protein
MNIVNSKVLPSIVALIIGSTTFGAFAQSETQSSQTTIERSTTVDVPKTKALDEKTTDVRTTTKRGVLGAEKSKTTTSSTTSVREPEATPSTNKNSTTTTETRKNY